MITVLETDADQALFQGEIDGIVATCHIDERPLRGLAGLLDWRFQGFISRFLKVGQISGKPGEVTYLPISRHGRTFHLLIAGAGYLPQETHAHLSTVNGNPVYTSSTFESEEALRRRNQVPPETMTAVRSNLKSLRIPKIAASLSDFGNVELDFFNKNMKGIPLWIVP